MSGSEFLCLGRITFGTVRHQLAQFSSLLCSKLVVSKQISLVGVFDKLLFIVVYIIKPNNTLGKLIRYARSRLVLVRAELFFTSKHANIFLY